MVHLWREGVQLEDYVFFYIDLFAEGLGGRGWGQVRPWFRGDQDDYAARQAFRVRPQSSELSPVSLSLSTYLSLSP